MKVGEPIVIFSLQQEMIEYVSDLIEMQRVVYKIIEPEYLGIHTVSGTPGRFINKSGWLEITFFYEEDLIVFKLRSGL